MFVLWVILFVLMAIYSLAWWHGVSDRPPRRPHRRKHDWWWDN